jgi:hypothetical protein
MTFNRRVLRRLWPVLFVVSAAFAEQTPVHSGAVRTDGLYRGELEHSDGTAYISVLRFAPDGRVFLTHVAMPARQERMCEWFKPELERQHWGEGASYRLESDRLSFRTVSLSATTIFDGTIDSGVLRLQLTVPTKQNLTYSQTFKFAPCL